MTFSQPCTADLFFYNINNNDNILFQTRVSSLKIQWHPWEEILSYRHSRIYNCGSKVRGFASLTCMGESNSAV